MTPYCKIDHVDKILRVARTRPSLKDITFEVEKGEYVSIIGHSGCGKSTCSNRRGLDATHRGRRHSRGP